MDDQSGRREIAERSKRGRGAYGVQQFPRRLYHNEDLDQPHSRLRHWTERRRCPLLIEHIQQLGEIFRKPFCAGISAELSEGVSCLLQDAQPNGLAKMAEFLASLSAPNFRAD